MYELAGRWLCAFCLILHQHKRLPMIFQHSPCLLASYVGKFLVEMSACNLNLTCVCSAVRVVPALIN